MSTFPDHLGATALGDRWDHTERSNGRVPGLFYDMITASNPRDLCMSSEMQYNTRGVGTEGEKWHNTGAKTCHLTEKRNGKGGVIFSAQHTNT